MKQKKHEAAFKYLIEEKSKQSKILNVKYEELKIQEYLLEGNKNTERKGKVDIKTQNHGNTRISFVWAVVITVRLWMN